MAAERGRHALAVAVKGLASVADALRSPEHGVTFLIYHRVGGGSGSNVDLPVALFDEQMAELAASGRVSAIGPALERLAGSAAADTPDQVVVTFDDGTVDLAEHALPVLERHGIPAVLYLATRFVDEGVDFPGNGRPLTWSSIAEMTSTGLVSVGSHTHSHALLDRLDPSDVDDELDRSIGLIEHHLGVTPLDFAYPKAVAGSSVAEDAVRARFRSAALAGTRPNPYGSTDLHRLARSPIQVADGMRWFRRKLAGGMFAEDALRRVVNRRRYAGATT
jgi:peptidoglycan/xylan/chitin deacetylase (PgdA/CDA1 family)